MNKVRNNFGQRWLKSFAKLRFRDLSEPADGIAQLPEKYYDKDLKQNSGSRLSVKRKFYRNCDLNHSDN